MSTDGCSFSSTIKPPDSKAEILVCLPCYIIMVLWISCWSKVDLWPFCDVHLRAIWDHFATFMPEIFGIIMWLLYKRCLEPLCDTHSWDFYLYHSVTLIQEMFKGLFCDFHWGYFLFYSHPYLRDVWDHFESLTQSMFVKYVWLILVIRWMIALLWCWNCDRSVVSIHLYWLL